MNWKSELADCITTPEQFAVHFPIDLSLLHGVVRRYPMQITPHTFKLIESANDPIWRQVVPDPRELLDDNLPEDSLNESGYSPVPAVVHRYTDRALLLVSGKCAGYCRFCTRKNRVGTGQLCFGWNQIEQGLVYLREATQVRDVILTGGDPLLLDDEHLASILSRLFALPHIEIVRIGSRIPVVLPSRITASLCTILARFQPLYLNTHFNHPREVTSSNVAACGLLANSGVPLSNQAVLLRGVNDDSEVMRQLCRELLKIRVRPYYLHHLDHAKGTGHFHVPVEKGMKIINSMRGQISGLGIPHYVYDPPDGSGKKPVLDSPPKTIDGLRS
ncbi:MAG: KamA family radical SAM protein [Deltaproteobacteria bacterium]|jgi:lysine 2,3-aminomutase|nr:KamA family radical SAM protein [Deltaproteobacteria bacterium]